MGIRIGWVGIRDAVPGVKNPSPKGDWTASAAMGIVMGALGGVNNRLPRDLWAGGCGVSARCPSMWFLRVIGRGLWLWFSVARHVSKLVVSMPSRCSWLPALSTEDEPYLPCPEFQGREHGPSPLRMFTGLGA